MVNKSKNMEVMEEGEQTSRQIHEVENTPFAIAEETINGVTKYYGLMGKYRLTEPCETLKKCKDEITNKSWNNIVRVCMLLIKDRKEVDKA